MSEYDARIFREWSDWQRNTVRLAVREQRFGSAVYLMPDGTWREAVEGAAATTDDGAEPGIVLPAAALEAIAIAIAEDQGDAGHAATEVRVLREWLTAERARVDKALGS